MEKDILENKKIAIIGTGHIGQTLLEGLLNSGIAKSRFIVTHPSYIRLKNVSKKYGVKVTINNQKAAKEAYFIFIAVKPFIVKEVIKGIKDTIDKKILLSVAATVNIDLLESYSENHRQKIIRLMPNIPIAQNHGVIGFYANKNIKDIDEKEIITLLSNLGEIIRVKKEKNLDILTLVSACGSAIVSYFIELLAKYGQSKGLTTNDSINIALKTFEGVLVYLKKTCLDPTQLRESVSTKGGITEKILIDLIKKGFYRQFEESMNEGYLKIEEIKNKLNS